MRIGYIPGPLDTLSGEHFPHLIHMQHNLNALKRKAQLSVLVADRMNQRYLKLQEIGFHYFPNKARGNLMMKFFHLLFFIAVYREIKLRIKHQRNDLFIVRFTFANYLVARYLRSRGCKILLEVHGLSHIEQKEFGQGYTPPLYIGCLRHVERKMLHLADEIITVSASLKKSLAYLAIDGERIHVVHNAIDPDAFKASINPEKIVRRHNLEGKTVVGFVGSFARYHGVEILIDVARLIQPNHEDVHFLIVGKNVHGSDNVVNKFLQSELAGIFTFTGEIPHSEVPLYIAAMDITVLPDFNDYGSPMKLFEYMAMSKAVVAPDVPPIREVIEEGRTALLFERKNAIQAAQCIHRLIGDKKLRDALGKRARKSVLSSHTWDQNAERIAGIAEGMIS